MWEKPNAKHLFGAVLYYEGASELRKPSLDSNSAVS